MSLPNNGFELHAKVAEEIDQEKVQFSELQKLGSGRGHTGAYIWSRSTHTPN